MARARFVRDFDWPIPGTRSFTACKAGQTYPQLKRGLVDDAVAWLHHSGISSDQIQGLASSFDLGRLSGVVTSALTDLAAGE